MGTHLMVARDYHNPWFTLLIDEGSSEMKHYLDAQGFQCFHMHTFVCDRLGDSQDDVGVTHERFKIFAIDAVTDERTYMRAILRAEKSVAKRTIVCISSTRTW